MPPLMLLTPLRKNLANAIAVSLLLHFDGPHNSTIIKNTAPYPVLSGLHDRPHLSALQSISGGTSLRFNGKSNEGLYVGTNAITDFPGDFTIEGAFFPESFGVAGSFRTLFNMGGGYNLGWCSQLLYVSANGDVRYCAASADAPYDIANGVLLGKANLLAWNTYAITRNGETYRLFLNGKLVVTINSALRPYATAAGRNMTIGGYPETTWTTMPNPGFNGFIDEMRITKGVARYVTDYTPLMQAFPTTADPQWANVTFLLQANGVDGKYTTSEIVDAKGNVISTLPAANTGWWPATITSAPRFGTASLSGGYLLAPESGDFGLNDFTVEGFLYINQSLKYYDQVVIGTRTGTSGSSTSVFALVLNGSTLRLVLDNTKTQALQVLSVSTWSHWAIVRKNGMFKLFVKGIQRGTFTDTASAYALTTKLIAIGAHPDGTTPLNNVLLDEIRITKGLARYDTNFAEPSSAFTL